MKSKLSGIGVTINHFVHQQKVAS